MRLNLKDETEEARKRRELFWKNDSVMMCPDFHFVFHDGKMDFYPVYRTHSVNLDSNYRTGFNPFDTQKNGPVQKSYM